MKFVCILFPFHKRKEMKILYTQRQIQTRIAEMANQIDALYQSVNEPIVAICVLRGAVYFFADLTRALKTPLITQYVKLGSYVNSTSTGLVTFDLLPQGLENKHVLVIEDIIDTGYSMNELITQLGKQKPKSIHLAALLNKQECREVKNLIVHFVGFEIPDHFVVGMGLDKAQLYRNYTDLVYFEEGDDGTIPRQNVETTPEQTATWSLLPAFLRG